MGARRAAPSAPGASAPRGARRAGAAGGRGGRAPGQRACAGARAERGGQRGGGGARPRGWSREPGGQVRAGRRAEPRCRDGAQPGRAPGPGPEHQAEREPAPEPQPEPGPGRGPGPRDRVARSGGDGAPQRLRSLLPAPCGWPGLSKPPRPGSVGIPPFIQNPENPRKAGGGLQVQPRTTPQPGKAKTSSVFRRQRRPYGTAKTPPL